MALRRSLTPQGEPIEGVPPKSHRRLKSIAATPSIEGLRDTLKCALSLRSAGAQRQETHAKQGLHSKAEAVAHRSEGIFRCNRWPSVWPFEMFLRTGEERGSIVLNTRKRHLTALKRCRSASSIIRPWESIGAQSTTCSGEQNSHTQ